MRSTLSRCALVIALAPGGACTNEPTQVLVTIDGMDDMAQLAVEVDGVEEVRTDMGSHGDTSLPLTLTLLHGGGGLGPISVAAVAYSGNGEAVARDCQSVSSAPARW